MKTLQLKKPLFTKEEKKRLIEYLEKDLKKVYKSEYSRKIIAI